MSASRNPRLDQLKGWLILAVIVGHIALGSIHTDPVRYAIYAFHMPLFIALSGFLINADSLKTSSVTAIVARYWQRVLRPFLPAFLFFTGVLALHAWMEQRIDLAWLVSSFASPYYHLWFVPTLVIWVIAYQLVLKLRLPLALPLVIALCASFVKGAFVPEQLSGVLSMLLSKKVVYFFFFFMLGAYIARNKDASDNLTPNVSVVLILLFVCVASIYYATQIGLPNSPLKALSWLVLNAGLFVAALIWALRAERGKTSSFLLAWVESMGRLSLPIYLWHVLPLFLLKGFDVHQVAPFTYYLCAILATVFIVAFIVKNENKYIVLDKWLYGVVNTNR